jgi:hypothetical protein
MHPIARGARRPLRGSLWVRLSVIALSSGMILFLSASGALAQCALTDLTCIANAAQQTVEATLPDAGIPPVDGAVHTVEGTAKSATDTVGSTVGGLLHPGGPGGGPGPSPIPGYGPGSGNGKIPSTTSNGAGVTGSFQGTSSVPLNPQDARPSVRPTSPSGSSLLHRIGGVVSGTAKQVGFPLALALIVVSFLLIQNRLDRNDPKLALAPIKPDVLSFG